MTLSKTQRMKLRKFVPLVVLYPLSTGIGVLTTIYVSKAINRSYPTSNVSGSGAASITPTTQPVRATSLSPKQLEERQRVIQLEAQISQLMSQIQKLDSTVSQDGRSQQPPADYVPSNGRNRISPPVTQGVVSPQRTAATAPPPTHGSTGASRAVR
ncbi:MAG: hypothetical protein EPN30_05975 [Actinomycetota bacterium]|nr:MAG: hypothetical protein EPN30_05975 [Actinomycetota bacterium]